MLLGELATADLSLSSGAGSLDITGLTADSRAVRPGYLFAALKGGAADGARFAGAAAASGAAAILADRTAEIAGIGGAALLRADDPRRALALLAARFYPRQPEKLVAVTGTSGKTSVTVFARQIFAAAGLEAASIGTIGVVTGRGAAYGSLTTPDPVDLHRTLDTLAGEGVSHAALEASSHGLDQHRLDGVRMVAAAFTNLGRDHMDYHATVADYLAAKLRLFREILPRGAPAVVDADSPAGAEVAAAAKAAGRVPFTVGRAGTGLRLLDAAWDGTIQSLTIEHDGRRHRVALPLAGGFQVSNALVAAGLAMAAGLDAGAALGALAELAGAPGRLEKVAVTPSGGTIFVDYAHKPEALREALSALRPMTAGRLVVVFGAGGNRDPGKRPMMGAIATEVADVVIVTDDNPRNEEPASIRAAILAAAPGATEIGDRGAAIAEAVAMLRAGDVLCIAGKGHETGQIVKGVTTHFSDHEAVAAAVARLAGESVR